MKKSFITLSAVLLMLFVVGCKTGKTGISKENLSSTDWQLSAIEGNDVLKSNYPNGVPSVVFTADNKINGHGGCNRYGGSYTLGAAGELTIGQMIATKMFCEGVAEDRYMQALSAVNRAEMKGNSLILYNGKDVVLTFVPKKTE